MIGGRLIPTTLWFNKNQTPVLHISWNHLSWSRKKTVYVYATMFLIFYNTNTVQIYDDIHTYNYIHFFYAHPERYHRIHVGCKKKSLHENPNKPLEHPVSPPNHSGIPTLTVGWGSGVRWRILWFSAWHIHSTTLLITVYTYTSPCFMQNWYKLNTIVSFSYELNPWKSTIISKMVVPYGWW